jgi:DNA-directed RNA polymerase specialized sigma24 family protein
MDTRTSNSRSTASTADLTLAEVRQEVDRILRDPADVARLRKISVVKSRGARLLDGEDLLQEAVIQLLSGERRWPRGMHAIQVLAMVMRSVASNSRTKRDYRLADDLIPRSDSDQTADAALDQLGRESANVVTPERELEGLSELQHVQSLVHGDEDLELLVEAWAEGLRGRDAMEELGWDENTHDAARKRLQRRLNGRATRSNR